MKIGHGGRRPGAGKKKGTKWPSTLAKEAVRERVRQLVTAHLESIIRAQIENACGLSYLVVRDRRTGKFLRVTESMARLKLGMDDEIIEVWEKEPNVQAAADLLNRAIDKPAEQSMKVSVGGNWDKWAARLASARRLDEP